MSIYKQYRPAALLSISVISADNWIPLAFCIHVHILISSHQEQNTEHEKYIFHPSFVVFCFGLTLINFTCMSQGYSLALGQSYVFPNASEVTLNTMGKYSSWIHFWVLNIANQNKTRVLYIDGLVQGRRNSTVLAMELGLSCLNPSIWESLQIVASSVKNLEYSGQTQSIPSLLFHKQTSLWPKNTEGNCIQLSLYIFCK